MPPSALPRGGEAAWSASSPRCKTAAIAALGGRSGLRRLDEALQILRPATSAQFVGPSVAMTTNPRTRLRPIGPAAVRHLFDEGCQFDGPVAQVQGGATFGDALPALGPELQPVSKLVSGRKRRWMDANGRHPYHAGQWDGRE
jgi:hypothetical protein